MPNSLIDAYRQQMAAQGTPDDRDDYFVMQDLVPLAQQNPGLLDKYPDFAREYAQYRDASAPSLGGEFTRALKSGTEETGSTYAGLGAIAKIPGAAEESKKLETEAGENAPTIGSLEDIAPGSSPIQKVFSKDALRYAISKAGGAIPSLAEMEGLALGGAAVGSAVEPGVGTVVGAGEGALETIFGGGIIKAAIKSIVKKGLVKDATEEGVASAIRAGDQKVADLVTQEAKGIAGGRAEAVTNLGNVYGMSAGGIYNETGDREKALELAAPAALIAAPPFVSLPARVARSLFPRLTGKAAQAAATELVGKKSAELLAKIGRGAEASAVGTAGVVGMEAANIVAKNLVAGRDALSLDESDKKRLREAAVGGAIGSLPFAAIAAHAPAATAPISLAEPEEEAPPVVPPAPDEVPAAPAPAPEPAPEVPLDVTPAAALPEKQVEAPPPDETTPAPELPAEEPPKPEYLYSHQPPQLLNGKPVPGFTQIDEIVNGENTRSTDLEQLASEGVNLPKPPAWLPRGQYTPEQVAEAISTGKPSVSLEEAGFKDQAAFEKAYAETHEASVFETVDEFLKRTYCQAA